MLPVFAAIAVAHDEGVIHRDLKPENIFLAHARHGRPEPKVLDFGISKISSSGGNTLALTGTGASMGTPYYIAPEQVRSAAGVDARSDQYALGAILYECVTGHRAHRGETIDEVIRSVGEGASPRRASTARTFRPNWKGESCGRWAWSRPKDTPRSGHFARAILPLATPARARKWAPAFAGDDGAAAARRRWPAASQPGGTVVFSTPAPGNGASARAGRATLSRRRRTPLLVPAPRRSRCAPATGGVAGGRFVRPRRRGSRGLLRHRPSAHRRPEQRLPAAPESAGATRGGTKAPARYRVAVIAHPREARFDLDGSALGTGRIDEELAADGAAHILTVSAAGFVPARLTFRDHPPADEVTLEPVAAAAPDRPRRQPSHRRIRRARARTPTATAAITRGRRSRPSGPRDRSARKTTPQSSTTERRSRAGGHSAVPRQRQLMAARSGRRRSTSYRRTPSASVSSDPCASSAKSGGRQRAHRLARSSIGFIHGVERTHDEWSPSAMNWMRPAIRASVRSRRPRRSDISVFRSRAQPPSRSAMRFRA